MQDRKPLIRRGRRDFSDLLDELGEPEAREDVDAVLKDMRKRRYYD